MNTKYDKIWAVSLFVIGVAAIVLSGSKVVGIELPDTMRRVLGLIDLAALAVFIYATVRRYQNKKRE